MLKKQNSQKPQKRLSSSSSLTRITFPQQLAYKQRANALFQKLNNFKQNLQTQKHTKFSQTIDQLKTVQQSLLSTTKDKQQHFQKVTTSLNIIDKQIKHQKTQFIRFQKIMDNIIQTTTRQTNIIIDKVNKQKQSNQQSIQKYINFKIQSFILKSNFIYLFIYDFLDKSTWLEQDKLKFDSYVEELEYLKNMIKEFYKIQQRETIKMKKQICQNLQKQKQYLNNQINRNDHEDIINGIQIVYVDIRTKVAQMTEKRQNIEQNVLCMIQNVVNSLCVKQDQINQPKINNMKKYK